MKTFTYTVKDKAGIHARPAGMLAKTAKNYQSEIMIEKDGKEVNAEKLIMIMGLNVKCGDTITVKISGNDEESASEAILKFFESTL